MNKKKAIMKKWRVIPCGEGKYALSGFVEEDEAQRGFNSMVTTSRILNIDFEKEKCETRNTIYTIREEDYRDLTVERW